MKLYEVIWGKNLENLEYINAHNTKDVLSQLPPLDDKIIVLKNEERALYKISNGTRGGVHIRQLGRRYKLL